MPVVSPHSPQRSPLSPLLLIFPAFTPSESLLVKEFGVALLSMECDGEGESGSGGGGWGVNSLPCSPPEAPAAAAAAAIAAFFSLRRPQILLERARPLPLVVGAAGEASSEDEAVIPLGKTVVVVETESRDV
jgi:hypothetical protein